LDSFIRTQTDFNFDYKGKIMTSFFSDNACCGDLQQTSTFDGDLKFRITELDPTISSGMPVKTPKETLKDLLQLGINKKSNLEIYKGIALEKTGRKNKDGIDDYMANLALFRPDHILELLLTQNEEKPGAARKDRSQIWRSTFKFMEENLTKDSDSRPGFSSFGNQDFQQILTLLCQMNPFFASALTFSEDKSTLELIAYKEGEPGDSDSLYLKLIRTLSSKNSSHNFNVYFDEDMKLRELKMIDQDGNMRVAEKDEFDYYASGALYNLLFYATAIHANIHILHDIMSSGIVKSTRHSKSMATWADHYDDNTAIAYVEVAALYTSAKLGKKEFGPESASDRILTGQKGLGGNADIMPILRQQICEWMKFNDANDFISKFVLQNFYSAAGSEEEKVLSTLEKFDILTEYRKHSAVIKDFAEDLTKAMSKDKSAAFEKTQQKLKVYTDNVIKETDDRCISTISSWVQLWNITNLTQESTSTFSRLSLMPEIMRWRNIDERYWEHQDVDLMCLMSATMMRASARR